MKAVQRHAVRFAVSKVHANGLLGLTFVTQQIDFAVIGVVIDKAHHVASSVMHVCHPSGANAEADVSRTGSSRDVVGGGSFVSASTKATFAMRLWRCDQGAPPTSEGDEIVFGGAPAQGANCTPEH